MIESRRLPLLVNGDHLDQMTFHERYEAMPEDFRAELIEGVVYAGQRRTRIHGHCHAKMGHWLAEYEDATPGTEGLLSPTTILADNAESEPDACLVIMPERGGQTSATADDYLSGAPEWIGEISDSIESTDFHGKKRDYEAAGVREYLVVASRSDQVFWFVRQRGKFKDLALGADGIYRSEVFPGLWLDPEALLKRNGKRLLAVLRQGLASPEHAAFIAKLAKRV